MYALMAIAHTVQTLQIQSRDAGVGKGEMRMKFRSPNTGEVFTYRDIIPIFCKNGCDNCPIIAEVLNNREQSCQTWIVKNPHEVAALMGYEVVEDDPAVEIANGIQKMSNAAKESAKIIQDYLNKGKEANMDKLLKDWTLGEVKAECEKHTAHCVGCPLWTDAAGCRLDTSCYRDNDPKTWDLSEPPRWTEQDKEDARKIKAMLPAGVALEMVRLEPGTLRLVIVDELSFVSLNKNLLPSLKPGERATLDEIIGGTNE